MVIVIMGVSGCGKTSIGMLLAEHLKLPFFDADSFHTQNNIDKMSMGIALNDIDRKPWLESLSLLLQSQESQGVVLACSALKESYRAILQEKLNSSIFWVLLHGPKNIISQRLAQRNGHFIAPSLLDSQFETLETPDYALKLSVEKSQEEIIQEIIMQINNAPSSQLGIIGLGVMGSNLALNFKDKGVQISVYNRQSPSEVNVAQNFANTHGVKGYDDLTNFVNSLAKPRKVLLMVNAGQAVDDVIDKLSPLLQEGDLIMDGGNSYFEDTSRRSKHLELFKINYIGIGISGGEEGARWGPAIMPGGQKEAYDIVAPMLDLIAAKDYDGKPCNTYISPDGAGHFVKMVHNGIEYAEMQILAETYSIMRYLMKLSPETIAETFDLWKLQGEGSYLLEITKDILLKKEGDELLLDKILDMAEQKGTGSWTLVAATELCIPLNTIADAVTARIISSMKEYRVKNNRLYAHLLNASGSTQLSLDELKSAFTAARIINHIVGFDMIKNAGHAHRWDLNLSEIARVWTNGCIIRSSLMERLSKILITQDTLLWAPEIVTLLTKLHNSHKNVVAESLKGGIALPVYSSSLNYFLSTITSNSTANLIQAQRDYFGAHRYKRVDKDKGSYFHTNWKE